MSQKTNSIKTMTEEQNIFAAENLFIVDRFLTVKRLEKDDFWDVVIFKYLEAVQQYLDRPELQQYPFATIAFRKMSDAVCHHLRYLNRDKRKEPVLGESTIYGSESHEYGNLGESGHVYEKTEARDEWAMILPLLTDKQLDSLKLRAQGYTGPEIAARSGISPGSVYARIRRARAKAHSFL